MVKHVVLNRLNDTNIKRDILSVSDLEEKLLQVTIVQIEDKEAAAMSVATGQLAQAAMTSYAKGRRQGNRDITQMGKCET